MATAAQIDANRANAQHSTGPKTPEGIAACRYNATRHGLTGSQVVIRGEDPAEYDALRASLLEQHSPASELEAMLVEQIAQNWWRLERARKIEAQIMDAYGLMGCMVDPAGQKAFRNITRYLAAIERSWRHACNELAALQKVRAAASVPPIGSVPQTTGAPRKKLATGHRPLATTSSAARRSVPPDHR